MKLRPRWRREAGRTGRDWEERKEPRRRVDALRFGGGGEGVTVTVVTGGEEGPAGVESEHSAELTARHQP